MEPIRIECPFCRRHVLAKDWLCMIAMCRQCADGTAICECCGRRVEPKDMSDDGDLCHECDHAQRVADASFFCH